jgi:hypothetical protein
MPRLEPDFQNTAFVLFGVNRDGSVGNPVGTGALVGMPARLNYGTDPTRHVYAVTNWHVACVGASIIRINTKSGKSRFLDLGPEDWTFISGGDDVAAVDITDLLNDQDEIKVIPASQLVIDESITQFEIGIGEDGFMLGLFADQPGKDRNILAARFGNLSMLANPAEPIMQPNNVSRPSHVFDMRSRPGFSGSPVFIYRTPDGDLRDMEGKAIRHVTPPKLKVKYHQGSDQLEVGYDHIDLQKKYIETRNNMFLGLLGIHAGQHADLLSLRRMTKRRGEADFAVVDGDKLEVPSSMTIVVPASAIWTLLKVPKFQEIRADRVEQDEARRLALTSVVVAESLPVKSEAPENSNPRHKEDFTSLLSAAATKNQQAD